MEKEMKKVLHCRNLGVAPPSWRLRCRLEAGVTAQIRTVAKFLLIGLLAACVPLQAQSQGCSVSGSDTSGDIQTYAYCMPQVLDGRTTLYNNSFAPGAVPSKGGWVALNRCGDQSNSERESYYPANVFIQNGILTEELRYEPAPCHYYPAQVGSSSLNNNFSSAFLEWNTFNFTYGDLQVRLKGPSATAINNGAWPALWLLGANCETTSKITADNATVAGKTCAWSSTGSEEIDFFEQNGTTTSYCNLYGNSGNTINTYTISDASLAFHVYEVQWTSGSLQFYYDGALQSGCTITGSNVPSTPMFLQMDLAVNSSGTSAATPATMQIDWVKVCQPSPCNSNGSNIVFFDDFVEPTAPVALHPLLRLGAMAAGVARPGAAYGLRAVPHFVERVPLFPEEKHVFKEMPCEEFSWFCSEY
jgi:beta-glucanase (GH16 family)